MLYNLKPKSRGFIQVISRDTHASLTIHSKCFLCGMCMFVLKSIFKIGPCLQKTKSNFNLVSQYQIYLAFYHFLISEQDSVSNMGLSTKLIRGPMDQPCQVQISGHNKISSVHVNFSFD